MTTTGSTYVVRVTLDDVLQETSQVCSQVVDADPVRFTLSIDDWSDETDGTKIKIKLECSPRAFRSVVGSLERLGVPVTETRYKPTREQFIVILTSPNLANAVEPVTTRATKRARSERIPLAVTNVTISWGDDGSDTAAARLQIETYAAATAKTLSVLRSAASTRNLTLVEPLALCASGE